MAKRVVTMPCIEIDPEERKRRLSRVYTILLDLAHRSESAEQAGADEPILVAAGDVPATAGG